MSLKSRKQEHFAICQYCSYISKLAMGWKMVLSNVLRLKSIKVLFILTLTSWDAREKSINLEELVTRAGILFDSFLVGPNLLLVRPGLAYRLFTCISCSMFHVPYKYKCGSTKSSHKCFSR